MASIVVGAIALSLRLLLTPLLPLPKPAIHDEFSYLLAADTFSHGRLTNPSHPMWIHFETFHVLSHPTYASKYPPGQGLVLALGQVFHAPWAAVWISMAVLSGLITWALWIWLEPPWAMVGGLLAAMQLTGGYWTESYWGGAVAAIGGALVVGALGRLLRRAAPGPALAFGLGLVILANTRPYEGLVLGASSAIFLLVHLIWLVRRGRQNSSQLVLSIGLPLAFVLLPAFIFMGYYNYRVTGDPLLTPHTLFSKQYESWSFLWLNHHRPEPKFDHEIFRKFARKFEDRGNRFARQHIIKAHLISLIEACQFFLGLPLLFCIIATSPRLVRIRRLRVPLLLLLVFYLGLSVEVNMFPHYFAPATVLVFLFAAAAVHLISSAFPPGKTRLVGTLALLCCIAIFDVFRVMDPVSRCRPWRDRGAFIANRDQVLTFLDKQPGQQLVLVRYGPHHSVHQEWVYNDANIDQSRIVWARAMPDGQDAELLRYYPNRRVWILDDDGRGTISPLDSDSAIAQEKTLVPPIDKRRDGAPR